MSNLSVCGGGTSVFSENIILIVLTNSTMPKMRDIKDISMSYDEKLSALRGYFDPPYEAKNKNCFSPISSY